MFGFKPIKSNRNKKHMFNMFFTEPRKQKDKVERKYIAYPFGKNKFHRYMISYYESKKSWFDVL